MNLIFLGAPGTGKGTIAAKIAAEHKFTHIAPGDLFRAEVKKGSELGKKVKSLIDAGSLVPDEITNAIVKQHIGKNTIFDGYPRTIIQAEALDTYAKIDSVILFDMSEQAIIERLAGRRVCPKCGAIYHLKTILPKHTGLCDKCNSKLIQRDDDKPEVIKNRFRVYTEQTLPLVDYYKKKKLSKTVDASGTPEEV